jgi:TetR/AcrR family transcriptional regulator, transcriptional repressor for nem operon
MRHWDWTMRYNSEHKTKTRERLLEEAAAAIKLEGPERISIAAIMARAGLTHGGFYAHFGSKEELIGAAIERMFEIVDRAFLRRIEGLEPAEALAYFIDDYLSARHFDSVSDGCPLPALSADVARLGIEIKAPFSHGFAQLQEHLADLFRKLGHQNAEAEELATSIYAEMVGAVSLARAIQDPDQAAKIRNQCRRSLKRRLGLNLPSGTASKVPFA